MSATAEDVLRIAHAEKGYTEKHDNRTKYGKAYGLNGVSWCGIFVWWVFDEAGYDLRDHGFSSPASTNALDQDGRHHARGWTVVPARDAHPGDVVIYDFGVTGPGDPANDADHTGICSRVVVSGSLKAIEGNTSPSAHGSQSNGGGVYEKTRALHLVKTVLRPPYPLITPEMDMPTAKDVAEALRSVIREEIISVLTTEKLVQNKQQPWETEQRPPFTVVSALSNIERDTDSPPAGWTPPASTTQ